MKKKWIEAMQYVDDKYIEEADPVRAVKGKRMTFRRTVIVLTACTCLVAMLLSVFVIAPYFRKNDVSHYKDSEYYTLIQKLNLLKKEQDRFLTDGIPEIDSMPEGEMPAPGGVIDDGESYEEITDNQVDGITEGDRIKRSDRYIYYLAESGTLYVYSIEGENAKRVGKYKINATGSNIRFNAESCEIYLSTDCKTVTVMMPVYNFELGMDCVCVRQLDVSDPTEIKEKNEVTVSGAYKSSRLIDDKFLMITHYSLVWDDVDYSDATTFVPVIEGTKGAELVAPDRILMPDKLTDTAYTVAALIDGESMETLGSAAFLSYSEEVYVSAENIFATRRFGDTEKKGSLVTTRTYTEISCLSYKGNTFTPKDSVIVEGYVKDRYSLDEKDGILRVVTTTEISQYREYKSADSASSSDWHSNVSASLYCVDIAKMETVAKVEGFAPSGETVQSVRYEGDHAYVCTAIQITDPVFFFDLSDLENITYKETETIDGFSSSLVDFENGMLLGIGRSDWATFKVEIYKEGEDKVESVCKYELADVYYPTDYKAYYIDRENQLVGLGVCKNSTGDFYYILLHFDGNELRELVKAELGGTPAYQRGFFKDGFFYMCGDNDFKVEKITIA